jgi:hypothetical protein
VEGPAVSPPQNSAALFVANAVINYFGVTYS